MRTPFYLVSLPALLVLIMSGCESHLASDKGSSHLGTETPVIDRREFANAEYIFIRNIKTPMPEAKTLCESMKMSLVHINSETENEFLREYAFSKPRAKLIDGDQFWIGASDQAHEGMFIWIDDNTIMWPKQSNGYTNWGHTQKGSQPNNFFKNNEDEDCVVLRNRGKNKGLWYDIGCTQRMAFIICEKTK